MKPKQPHWFRARFDAMLAALRAHPQVEVYQALAQPPATEANLLTEADE